MAILGYTTAETVGSHFFARGNSACSMYIDKLSLPIVQENIRISIGTAQEQFLIIGGQEINIPKGAKLFTIDVKGFVSRDEGNSPWSKQADQRIRVEDVRRKILYAAENKTPVAFEFHSINWSMADQVTIEDPVLEERGGEPGDFYYEFRLRRYVDPAVKKIVIDSSGNTTNSSRKADTTQKKINTTYTVVKGDCLYRIAKKQLGDSSRWPEIYELNKEKIKNPNLIYPGMELKLPVDSTGKKAGSDDSSSTVKPEKSPDIQSGKNTGVSGGSGKGKSVDPS